MENRTRGLLGLRQGENYIMQTYFVNLILVDRRKHGILYNRRNGALWRKAIKDIILDAVRVCKQGNLCRLKKIANR